MKVINLEQTFCKEYLQKFFKENYCKLLSNSEAQEDNHKQIMKWLENMITKGNWSESFEEDNLVFQRSMLLLVDFCTEESEMNTFIVHGGAIFEYHTNYNCGIIKFLSLLPQDKDIHEDDQARCRLLMDEVMSVFNKHANGAKFEVFSIVRKSNFDTPASNGNILRRQRHLYNAGFRLVNVHHFGNSVQHFLSVYQPELPVPNYQVEDGITTGWVSAESIKKVCEIFGFPFCGKPLDVSVEVFSEFPWCDHLDPAPQSEIAVIGAGIAGLAAAASLCQAGFRVVLLEAANYIGGRVKQQQPFDGFPPIDLGGEFVHGSDSVITNLIREYNWAFTPAFGVGSDQMAYINGHLRHFEDDDPVLHAAHKAWDDIIYFGRKQYNVEEKTIRSAMEKLVKVINGENRNSTDGHLQPPPLSCSKQTKIKQIIQDRWQSEKCSHSEDCSVYDWMVEHGYSSQIIDIIDAREGQSWATSLKMLGVFEASREEDSWSYGSENFRLEGSYSLLIKHYLDTCEMVEKRVNWQVREVIWKARREEDSSEQKYPESICIKNQNGETLEAKYVIVTVPLTVLQDGDIRFVPCLPVEKQIAISSIHMGGALKIVCRFTKQFWPSSLRALYAASGFISQLWFYSRDPESRDEEQLNGEKCHLATGFATDQWADRIRHMDETQLCMRFLQQLDEIFRTRDSPKPASDSFMDHVLYDWKKNPFVRGGYSSPTLHACGMREKLARSVDDQIFFAGEATNINVASTIQSAIETGVRAAEEVCQAWKKMEWRNKVSRS